MNRLTAVPIDIVPIMAMDNGFCSSEPISEENKSGTMAKTVVSEVMIMGRRRLRPASWMASSKDTCFTQFIDCVQFQDRVIDYDTAGDDKPDG